MKDRLAAFYHWNDRQSLEQALLVARDQEVDLLAVRNWSEREGNLWGQAVYCDISDQLSKAHHNT